jgi:hypothetical protein
MRGDLPVEGGLGERRLVGLVVAVLAVADMSMTTSRWNFTRNSSASCATMQTASGSSPFTWKIGASIILATSVQ